MTFTPHLLVFETLPTTMLEARARARAGASEGTTILARTQTSGRGRLGRTWVSEPGTGIWMTSILRPPPERTEQFGELSLVTGLAVCEALRDMGVGQAMLKWPNDVVVPQQAEHTSDRKLAGILLEADGPVVLAGIGVNLAKTSERDLPDEIATRYTGVYDYVGGSPSELTTHVRAILGALATWYDRWKRDGFAPLVAAYDRLDALRDAQVQITGLDGSAMIGTASGVNAQGELIVETKAGTTTVRAGEVERVRR
jgi:BirA family biotin operon repressor/biotin-[acetyl-CoA-carboxylase] ligase